MMTMGRTGEDRSSPAPNISQSVHPFAWTQGKTWRANSYGQHKNRAPTVFFGGYDPGLTLAMHTCCNHFSPKQMLKETARSIGLPLRGWFPKKASELATRTSGVDDYTLERQMAGNARWNYASMQTKSTHILPLTNRLTNMNWSSSNHCPWINHFHQPLINHPPSINQCLTH